MASEIGTSFGDLKRSRSVHMAQLTKLYKDLEKNMISYDNEERVKQLYEKLCERFEQFKSSHSLCMDMCTQPEVRESLEARFDSCEQNLSEFRERFSEWSAKHRHREEMLDVEGSIISNSRRSVKSAASSRSKLQNAKVMRLVAEHKLRKLKERQELERARKDLEMKQELFEQSAEVEEAMIVESVLQEALNEETTSTLTPESVVTDSVVHGKLARQFEDQTPGDGNQDVRVMEDFNMHATSIPERTERVRITETSQQTGDIESAFEKLASALQEGFTLPKPELLTFSGNSIDYCKFIKNFETNVESRVSDYQLRLSYLIQYCKGEAKSSIEDCVLLEPKEGYLKAREILFSRYGKSHLVARSFIEKIVNGSEIKASNVNELSKLALEMQKCEITLSQLGFKSDIDNSDNLRRIVRRLPTHLRTR